MFEKARVALSSQDRYQRFRDYAFARLWYSLPERVRASAFRGRGRGRGFRGRGFSGGGGFRGRGEGESHYCPVCEHDLSRFIVLHRPNQLFCPVCRSMQRHRLVMLFLRTQTDLYDGRTKRLLHIAPEPSLGPRLQRAPNVDYISGDLMDPSAMVRLDITRMQFEDGSFDCLYCSHVLEHVPDDRQAMEEMFRVLKPGGWALVLVPIRGEHTYEDWTITSPQDRERAFGQHDHVRYYGMDFRDRLARAGFRVRVYQPDQVAGEHSERMGLHCKQIFFFCRKPLSVPGEDERRDTLVEEGARPAASADRREPIAVNYAA